MGQTRVEQFGAAVMAALREKQPTFLFGGVTYSTYEVTQEKLVQLWDISEAAIMLIEFLDADVGNMMNLSPGAVCLRSRLKPFRGGARG